MHDLVDVYNPTSVNLLILFAQEICREVDRRREDMKQLVQMLDTLVSRRADEEALKEQDQLESLITRYKNLVPTGKLEPCPTNY